jgi:galactoside O-acetyltransferase
VIGGQDGVLIMADFTNISAGSKIVCCGEDFTEGMLNPIVPVKYRKLVNKPVIMERFSAIGVNSVVLQGVRMAEGSVLGANSLLTKDTEPWTIYVGSPAKPIKKRDSELILKAYKELGYEY